MYEDINTLKGIKEKNVRYSIYQRKCRSCKNSLSK